VKLGRGKCLQHSGWQANDRLAGGALGCSADSPAIPAGLIRPPFVFYFREKGKDTLRKTAFLRLRLLWPRLQSQTKLAGYSPPILLQKDCPVLFERLIIYAQHYLQG